ncbi:Long-chain-acyl-CoA dehydrogenase [Mycolicibacterium rhodesiae JS60]|nr:Long-chain-acyl-CoA dehydrogenase [Mycolicibacterium rhodesiae JS60]
MAAARFADYDLGGWPGVKRDLYGPDHEDFRKLVRTFFETEVAPQFSDWEEAGMPPLEFYRRAGEIGIVGLQVPEQFGGGGVSSFLFNTVVTEEAFRAGLGLGSLRVHMDIVLPYLLHYANEEQQQRWLPGCASGELMTAIAMTEPGTGSDLAGIRTTATRDGDTYVLNGAKTFITGGANAGLILTVARTSAPTPQNRRSGLSILVVEKEMPGFTVGTNLKKIGLKAQDTTELFYADVRVPAANLLGEEGAAFDYLTRNLAQERLTIAVASMSAAATALDLTVAYVKERQVFGKQLSTFQNTKFVLAECATKVEAGHAMVDRALVAHEKSELSVADAAKVKLFATEVQGYVVDECLQLFGGYGYMLEYPIARLYSDARVTRVYGGTSEVIKTIIAKDLGL